MEEILIGTDLQLAQNFLEKGDCVAIPTETVYGLAANALNPEAVAKIFEIKNRPAFDPLIVHIGSLDQVDALALHFPEIAQKLVRKFWPGPLTIILPKKNIVPDLVSSGLNTVGIRMPDHPITLALLRNLDFPLAAPSANPFGYISPTTARHVADQLAGKLPYILNGGPCHVGIESTIVSFINDIPQVLRLGGLSIEAIEAVIGKTTVSTQSTSNPAAPGMLSSHYAPRKPLVMGDIADLVKKHEQLDFEVLAFRDLQGHPGIALSKAGDLREAASNLFAALRTLDQSESDIIFAEPFPETGLGRAINDRLRRAAGRHTD